MTKVVTDEECMCVCLFNDLPIIADLCDIKGKRGVYYEVVIGKMDRIITIGNTSSAQLQSHGIATANTVHDRDCMPSTPSVGFPGWERLSVGLHPGDYRKFYEDPDGGRDYDNDGLLEEISPGDSIGLGYEPASGTVFFTYNGTRLPSAFSGIYIPQDKYDVYVAIGVLGKDQFRVNFGTDTFKWREGNDWAWKVEGHVGNFAGSPGGDAGELPNRQEAVRIERNQVLGE